MNTHVLPITKELTSATSFRYIEVVAPKYSGISQPALKLRLSNNTTEFNLYLQPSLENQSYAKVDLLAIVQDIPGLAYAKFDRLQFSIYSSDNSSDQSSLFLLLYLQEQS